MNISPTMTLRASIKNLEQNFAKFINLKFKEFSEEYDKIISQVIETIKQTTEKIDQNTFEKLIFLVGSTGAGKSTLMNYIALGDEKFYVHATDGDSALIKPKTQSITEVGGKQPTTIVPVPFKSGDDTFLDCAGEGDTGIIIEIINAIIKSKISENVKQAKILIVTTFSSLGSENGYGRSFKLALEKNSEFMGEMDFFKDSIGFVVTRAPTCESAIEETEQKFEDIMNHADMNQFKDVIQQILVKKRVSYFCGPQNRRRGSDYKPPNWNSDQWNILVQNIKIIPYNQIPYKGFFKVSTTEKIREALRKALDAKVQKAINMISKIIQDSLPLKIYGLELERVIEFINNLMIGCESSLIEYFKILGWNNFLKGQFDMKQVENLHEEIEYLNQFAYHIEQNSQKYCFKINWSSNASVADLLRNVYQDGQKILYSKQNYFLKKTEHGLISAFTVKEDLSNLIANDIKELNTKYKQRQQIILLGNHNTSMYYNDEIKTELQTTIQEEYKEMEKRSKEQSYQDWIGPTYETYLQKVQKKRPVIKYRTETYTENQQQMKKVIKMKTQTYTQRVPDGRNLWGIPIRIPVEKTRQVPDGYDWISQTVQVVKERILPYTEQEVYYENEQRVRQKTAGHYVTRQRLVIEEVEVTKYRPKHIFKSLTIRVLDEPKLIDDLEQCTHHINLLKANIQSVINEYPNSGPVCPKPPIMIGNEVEQNYKDLLEKWRDAQFNAYFHLNPLHSLNPCTLDSVKDQIFQLNNA